MEVFVLQAVWSFLILPTFSGENLCTNELLLAINISTELQADVLLPCNFNPSLLGSDRSADVAVVWSQKNTTSHSLVEINLQGDVKFWNNKGGRVMTFPKLSESGNFSIVLQRVRPYDVGLYCCQLFNGTTCITYQEIHLQQQSREDFQSVWIIVGVLTGVTVLLVVFIAYFFHAKRRQNIKVIEFDYENTVGEPAHSHRGNQSIENPVYDTFCQLESNIDAREEEGLSSETPVYAVVKKGKIVNR